MLRNPDDYYVPPHGFGQYLAEVMQREDVLRAAMAYLQAGDGLKGKDAELFVAASQYSPQLRDEVLARIGALDGQDWGNHASFITTFASLARQDAVVRDFFEQAVLACYRQRRDDDNSAPSPALEHPACSNHKAVAVALSAFSAGLIDGTGKTDTLLMQAVAHLVLSLPPSAPMYDAVIERISDALRQNDQFFYTMIDTWGIQAKTRRITAPSRPLNALLTSINGDAARARAVLRLLRGQIRSGQLDEFRSLIAASPHFRKVPDTAFRQSWIEALQAWQDAWFAQQHQGLTALTDFNSLSAALQPFWLDVPRGTHLVDSALQILDMNPPVLDIGSVYQAVGALAEVHDPAAQLLLKFAQRHTAHASQSAVKALERRARKDGHVRKQLETIFLDITRDVNRAVGNLAPSESTNVGLLVSALLRVLSPELAARPSNDKLVQGTIAVFRRQHVWLKNIAIDSLTTDAIRAHPALRQAVIRMLDNASDYEVIKHIAPRLVPLVSETDTGTDVLLAFFYRMYRAPAGHTAGRSSASEVTRMIRDAIHEGIQSRPGSRPCAGNA